MWKKLKRPLAFVLTLAMLVSLANFEQFSVLAEGAPEATTTTAAAESKTSDKKKDSSEKKSDDPAPEKKTTAEKKESEEAKSEDKSEENKEKASESETEAAPESTTGKKEEGTSADKKEDGTSEKKENGTSEKKADDEKEAAFSSEKTTDDITVKAEAEKGVLPDGTQMELTYVGTKSDSVDNAFKEKEITTDNYIAVKAVFTKDGKEVTPDGKVKMTITMPESKLGENANAESLKMRRIKKSDDKTDVDTMAVYGDSIDVKDGNVKASFGISNVRIFAFTWNENNSLKVNAIDEDGNALEVKDGKYNKTKDSSAAAIAVDYSVNNYIFKEAVIGTYTVSKEDDENSGNTVALRFRCEKGVWQYSSETSGDNYNVIGEQNVNFVYAADSELEEQTVEATIYKDASYKEELTSDTSKIVLKGNLPKDAVVKAYPAEIKTKAFEDEYVLAIYDITIFDTEGNEYEPNAENPISVSITSDLIAQGTARNNINVYHMDDEELPV